MYNCSGHRRCRAGKSVVLGELEAIVITMEQEILEVKIGTGGLLIIYGNKINNNNLIESNGVSAIYETVTGGSSGGGSINLFYNENYNNNGTITVGSIKTGAYEKIDVDGSYTK